MSTSVILRLLDAILLLIPRATGMYLRFQAIRDEIVAMGVENPTDAQWEDTDARSDATLARLRAKRSTTP